MRFVFGEAKGPFKAIDVDQSITGEKLQELLVNEHNFKQGNYTFISAGKVLKYAQPLATLAENAQIITFIKNKAPAAAAPAAQAPATPAPAPAAAPKPAQPAAAPQPQTSQPRIVDNPPPQRIPANQPIPPRGNAPRQPQDLRADIERAVVQPFHLREIYDEQNSLQNNLDLYLQASATVQNNPSAVHCLDHLFTMQGLCPNANAHYLRHSLYLMMGLPVHEYGNRISNYNARLEQLSKKQRDRKSVV